MGFYINRTSTENIHNYSYQEKIDAIIFDGGFIIDLPTNWSWNLVCVVNNGFMSGAGYAFSKNEMKVFLDTSQDHRPRTWLKYDNAMEMAGYDGNKRVQLKNLKDK